MNNPLFGQLFDSSAQRTDDTDHMASPEGSRTTRLRPALRRTRSLHRGLNNLDVQPESAHFRISDPYTYPPVSGSQTDEFVDCIELG